MVEATLSPAKGSSVTAPTRDDYAPWLALGRVKGLGCAGFKKLAARFTDPTKIFSAWVEVEQEIRRTREAGIELVPFTSPNYPARLRMIADPPPFLYVKGTLRAEDDKAVAIVGSRSASDYGRRMARDLARGLANLGFTVISGMARGIDGTAHDTVLQSGGRTIAVLGSG